LRFTQMKAHQISATLAPTLIIDLHDSIRSVGVGRRVPGPFFCPNTFQLLERPQRVR